MRYVAAYLLTVLGGKTSPSPSDVEKVLSSVGIEVEKEKLQKVIDELKDKSIDEVIAEGRGKLASMPVGGAAPASSASAPAAGAPAAAEEKKEEKKAESESEDDDMGFGLFD